MTYPNNEDDMESTNSFEKATRYTNIQYKEQEQ